MALWVGSRDPCLSQESWWIWLTHFLALGPGVTPGGFERLCLSWLSVISERDHSGWGDPHRCSNFHKESDLWLEWRALAADTRQSMCGGVVSGAAADLLSCPGQLKNVDVCINVILEQFCCFYNPAIIINSAWASFSVVATTNSSKD